MLTLDRAQVLCHSEDDTCKYWVAPYSQDEPSQTTIQLPDIWVGIDGSTTVSMDELTFIKTFFRCNLDPDKSPDRVYFKLNDSVVMCKSSLESKSEKCSDSDRWDPNMIQATFKPGVQLLVLGRASNVGPSTRNLQLGEERAQNVADELSKKWPSVRIETLGDIFGGRIGGRSINKKNSASELMSSEDNPKERRVDIYVCRG